MALPALGTVNWDDEMAAHLAVGHFADGGNRGILSGVYDLSLNGCALDGSTDDQPAVQAIVDACPDVGAIIYHPGGICKLSSAVDLQGKRIHFLGSTSTGTTNPDKGAWFSSGTAGQTLFTCKPAAQKQTSPTFERLAFSANHAGVTLFDTLNTNRLKFRDCMLLGHTDLSTIGLVLDFTSPGAGFDSSWHRLDETIFYSLAIGIKAIRSYGGTMTGGQFIGCTIGADMQGPTSSWKFFGVKGDGGNPCFNLLGKAHAVYGTSWETLLAGTYLGFVLGGSGTPPSGQSNSLWGCHCHGTGDAGNKGLEITANANAAAVFGMGFSNLGVNYTDAGVNTTMIGTYGAGLGSQRFGAGSPEGVIAGNPGAIWMRTDGGATTTLYVKTSGTGNTGWTAK